MSERPGRVLIVDDVSDFRLTICRVLERDGIVVSQAGDGPSALEMIAEGPLDVVLLDIQLPLMDGHKVLRQLRDLHCNIPVVIITGFGSIPEAVRVMKEGAFDYLTKPFKCEDLMQTVRRALNVGAQGPLRTAGSGHPGDEGSLAALMGTSLRIRHLAAEVERVAPTDFSILLEGETGAGKEVVARAVHGTSLRSARPFVALDCGALPENLIESELFGYEKGAFTGAHKAKVGRFEVAEGGTLFLDEISNLSPPLQNKLLRVLQERQFYRVGGLTPLRADVRILAASNRNLDSTHESVDFRSDLYHRLSEYVIRVPPLRERKEDLPFLVDRFVRLTNAELGKQVRGISEEALEALMNQDWPGNVRQLRNCVRRGVLWTDQDELISVQDLGLPPVGTSAPAWVSSQHPEPMDSSCSLKELVQTARISVERRAIANVLGKTEGNIAKAARVLKVDYKTMHSKIKTYGIRITVSPDLGELAAAEMQG